MFHYTNWWEKHKMQWLSLDAEPWPLRGKYNEKCLYSVSLFEQNVMACWWYYSNVAAHVANYEVQMTKHSNYGIEFDLITIDGVYELTRSVCGSLYHTQGGSRSQMAKRQSPVVGGDLQSPTLFLLNTIEDEDNLPDRVIDADGNISDDLEIVSDDLETALRAGDASNVATAREYVLTVTADHEGWAYGRTQDPTNCTMTLVKAVRQSDGTDVTSNVWQTDRTVQADYTAIVDNRSPLQPPPTGGGYGNPLHPPPLGEAMAAPSNSRRLLTFGNP